MEQKKILFYDCKAAHGEFSNFYKAKKKEAGFIYHGKVYATSEHYYQAKKFDYDGASEVSKQYAELIRTANTPNIAFCYANQVCNSPYPWAKPVREKIKEYEALGIEIDPEWNEKCEEVMYEAVLGKFQQNQRLQKLLLATFPYQLVEHTHRDSFWADGGDGSGENRLGVILMQVREKLVSTVSSAKTGKRSSDGLNLKQPPAKK